MGEAALVIEAATEREAIKRQIFERVAPALGPDAILATNTSSIPITRLAQVAPDAGRFVGVHFFYPVPVMGLIELIRGLATSDETVARVEAYAQALGKRVVRANDAPGFIVNRVLMPMLNEACFALGEGVATIPDIDAGCELGLNHPMGPLRLADFIGLGHLPGDHAGAVRGDGRSQVPPGAAACQICRGGLVRPQERARLLRLFRRGAGADALTLRLPRSVIRWRSGTQEGGRDEDAGDRCGAGDCWSRRGAGPRDGQRHEGVRRQVSGGQGG